MAYRSDSKILVNIRAHVLDICGFDDDIDFARVGGILGIASGVLGFIIGQIAIAIGKLGVIGGAFGAVASGVLGIIAGGVLGVIAGGAVGSSISSRTWDFRRSLRVLTMHDVGGDADSVASNLMATVPWRVLRMASRLMPRGAGMRWLAEAESYLFEAPPSYRLRATRNYLLTAPRVIVTCWVGVLAKRNRLTGGPAGKAK